jgi:hypothetical protein|tara:strand:- start:303 stop:428 length:126 start_codon:yes stop_codon:yes gene_type:complete
VILLEIERLISSRRMIWGRELRRKKSKKRGVFWKVRKERKE